MKCGDIIGNWMIRFLYLFLVVYSVSSGSGKSYLLMEVEGVGGIYDNSIFLFVRVFIDYLSFKFEVDMLYIKV